MSQELMKNMQEKSQQRERQVFIKLKNVANDFNDLRLSDFRMGIFPYSNKESKIWEGRTRPYSTTTQVKGGNMMWFDGPQTLLIFKHEDVFQKYKDTRD